MKPRLRGGGTVGAKPKPVAAAALKICTCTSQGCASETTWDIISQKFVTGRLVGLKEFEHHKVEEERLCLATKLTPLSPSSATHAPVNELPSDGKYPPSPHTPDIQTPKSGQRHERKLFKGFRMLLDLQDRLHTSETRWEEVQGTLDNLAFVYPPSLHDSPLPKEYPSTNVAHRILNDGPYALLYNNPSNALLIHYEEELLQLLHACDGIVDLGDKELHDAKLALECEVENKFLEIEQMKAKAWQRQKFSTGANKHVIKTGKQTMSWPWFTFGTQSCSSS